MQSLSNHVTFACNTLANIIREIIKMVSFYNTYYQNKSVKIYTYTLIRSSNALGQN